MKEKADLWFPLSCSSTPASRHAGMHYTGLSEDFIWGFHMALLSGSNSTAHYLSISCDCSEAAWSWVRMTALSRLLVTQDVAQHNLYLSYVKQTFQLGKALLHGSILGPTLNQHFKLSFWPVKESIMSGLECKGRHKGKAWTWHCNISIWPTSCRPPNPCSYCVNSFIQFLG